MINLSADNEMAIVECNFCHQKDEYDIIDVIDSELDIFEKNKLIGGTLFEHKCSNCGKSINYYYNMVYYDKPHNVMIYYVPNANHIGPFCAGLALTNLSMTRHAVEFGEDLPEIVDWIQRVVCSPSVLMEKAIIFEAGLDDRVIEIIKLMCLSLVFERHPNFIHEQSKFYIENGLWFIELCGLENKENQSHGSYTVGVQCDMYNKVLETAQTILEDSDKHFVIDEEWALNVLEYDGKDSLRYS